MHRRRIGQDALLFAMPKDTLLEVSLSSYSLSALVASTELSYYLSQSVQGDVTSGDTPGCA